MVNVIQSTKIFQKHRKRSPHDKNPPRRLTEKVDSGCTSPWVTPPTCSPKSSWRRIHGRSRPWRWGECQNGGKTVSISQQLKHGRYWLFAWWFRPLWNNLKVGESVGIMIPHVCGFPSLLGYPQARWMVFLSWKIPIYNGWWLGVALFQETSMWKMRMENAYTTCEPMWLQWFLESPRA